MPALAALLPLSSLDAPVRREARRRSRRRGEAAELASVLADRRLLTFAACAMLFTLANAAMLPLASTALTKRAGGAASLLIAACIVLPQLMVALLSPRLGWLAEARGRRLVLLLGFAMLPLRGVLFALVTIPTLVVLVQTFDGIAGGVVRRHGAAGHQRHCRSLRPFQPVPGGRRLRHRHRRHRQHHAGRAGSATISATRRPLPASPQTGLAATLLVWRAMPETRPLRPV